jgi:GT2 family glycosyltransferase
MNILPVVVLYNIDYRATNAYRTLLSQSGVNRILLYENSPEPQNQCYESPTVCYHHDAANGGVSAAYNYGADLAEKLGDVDALLLLDEDTQFQPDYLSRLQSALEQHPDISLFVPQVLYAGEEPFSPIHRGLRRKRGALLGEGRYSLKRYLPVNSGACIRLLAFRQAGGYNAKIRLDFADFDFFSRLAEVSATFYRVDSIARQSFSNEETRVDRLFRRYQFYLEGARVARCNRLISTIVNVEVLRHVLALTLRTRKWCFLSEYIKRFL